MKDFSLQDLFKSYTSTVTLKPDTAKNYKEVIYFYLRDWLKKPVSSINKQMIEKRFYRIRDKGMYGGIPTYSSATKTMRILSALMNYAMAFTGKPVSYEEGVRVCEILGWEGSLKTLAFQ